MKQSNWDEYRSLMNDVELPDRVHARVMREVRKEHAAETGPKPRPRPRARRTQPSFAFKAAVAAFCAVALTTGVAFASGMVELPEQLFSFNQLSDKPNSFTLEAYAAEGSEGGDTVLLDSSLFRGGGGYSGSWYNPADGTFWGPEWAGYKFAFNLKCSGQNIESLTYEIEGDRSYFEFLDPTMSSIPLEEREGDGKAFHYRKSFTVGYGEQWDPNGEFKHLYKNQIVHLYVGFPLPQDAIDAMHHITTIEHTDDLTKLLDTAVETGAAREISASLLTVTATFSDGTSQSKAYAIAPIDTFAEAYSTFWDARNEAAKQEREQGNSNGITRPDMPRLYTITEVDAS
ncbi:MULTISPECIES: hypothetical protein [Paraeggerthella]|uniref:hypothetical protein n=1 Tax=Paraeggerthella TaxID=651554 RepID=UPI0011C056FD